MGEKSAEEKLKAYQQKNLIIMDYFILEKQTDFIKTKQSPFPTPTNNRPPLMLFLTKSNIIRPRLLMQLGLSEVYAGPRRLRSTQETLVQQHIDTDCTEPIYWQTKRSDLFSL